MSPGPGTAADRPRSLVVVAGTGTEVGKTWVAAAVLRALRQRGLAVAARKPAQSFGPDDGPTDAEVLGAATGEDPEVVCPPHRWYPVPMAPPMAAEALGRTPLTLAELIAEVTWPPGLDVGLVETAGGVRSPQCADADVPEVIAGLAPDAVVLVADAGLGTLNGVRLALAALPQAPAPRVHLNRYDPTDDLHLRNRAWLAAHDGLRPTIAIDPLVDAVGAREAPR